MRIGLLAPLLPLDAGIPFLAIPLGIGFLLLLGLIVTAIETLVLVALKWASWRTSLRDSLIANLLSTLVGLVVWVAIIMGGIGDSGLGFWFLTLVGTVLIEWAYLQTLHRHTGTRLFGTVVAMNVASYGGMLLVLTLLSLG